MFDSIGFIGAGRIAHILLGGWRHTHTALPRVLVHDPSAAALASLQQSFPEIHVAEESGAASTALVLLAVHPFVMEETLTRIATQIRDDAVVISLAPKLRLNRLQALLPASVSLVRMNPNAPAIIGQGFNPVSFGADVPDATRKAVLALMGPLGESPEVPDPLIEACAVVSAMGPTYFWFQFQALRQMAEQFGMPPPLAKAALRQMLHGAVETLFASDLPAERVMDLVPVKPLAPDEATIEDTLRERVGSIHAKLTA